MPDASPPLGDTRGGNKSPVVAFPHIRAPERLPPNNLPLQLTSFVGREREIAEVKDLLAEQRSGETPSVVRIYYDLRAILVVASFARLSALVQDTKRDD